MKKKIQFIFAGRLVKEKGFDLVLGLFDEILMRKDMSTLVEFHIFSDGFYREKLETGIKEKWGSFVQYHGQQPKKKILEMWKKMHYTLVPSRFLETFGLVGLDSLSVGVPVIGPKKGGLGQFVFSGNQMKTLEVDELFLCVDHIVKKFSLISREKQRDKTKKIFEKYTRSMWIERFQELSGLEPGAKVLLVSDYIVNVGGIESFLFNVKDLLEEYGYTVMLLGCDDKWLAYNRLVSLFGTFWNNKGAKLFRKKTKEFKPDLVWRHSIQRRFGPLVLYEARHCRAKQWVMYHDFGLFHPYPSRVYKEEQIYRSNRLGGYMKESFAKSVFLAPLVLLKRASAFLIKRQLEKVIDMHLVPSAYIERMVQVNYPKLQKEKIQTFRHFI